VESTTASEQASRYADAGRREPRGLEIRCTKAMAQQTREKILPSQLERRVYERLRDEIVSGLLRPGEQLVEARIAADLGVSKTPVREALIRLQRDGLVEIEPYRGAHVVEPSAEDVREILELRLLIESQIARDLAERQPVDILDALGASVAESRAAFEAGDSQRLLGAITEFSDVLAGSCDNSRMVKLLADLRSVLLLIGNTSLRAPGREARSIAEHERIIEALRAGDADAAAAATADHIHSIERDSLQPPSRPRPSG
jgi:DNA-binding GntR family transcriptional regulator